MDEETKNLNLRILASYVPKNVLKKLQLHPKPIVPPQIEHKNAAVLFADISGFTPLTEKMSKLGARGIELMTMHLNNFFDQLIQKIHLYGGDIIKFAGDALLAVWADDIHEDKLPKLVNLACQCALDIQYSLHNYIVEECVLRLHIGIGAGKISFVHVGGEDNTLEFLITGSPLEQVGACEQAAAPGEVYISYEAASLVQDDFRYGKRKGVRRKKFAQYTDKRIFLLSDVKNPEPPRPADYLPTKFGVDIQPLLLPYIAPAIKSRFSVHQCTTFGEMRVITVIFANLELGDLNENPEVILQAAFRSIQADLYQYEGTIRQFLIDDKGSVMIGVFGTPPKTHEDDPPRAVLAALKIQKNLLEKVNIQCSIGVTTGQAFVGDVGNQERREYAMVGDIVNLSARLMAICPLGEIRIDHATYKECVASQWKFQMEALVPVKVKGKEFPIEIYRPSIPMFSIHRKDSRLVPAEERNIRASKSYALLHPRAPHLIGRTEELAELKKYFDIVTEGKFQLVILQGDAGIGKTFLLREFRLDILSEKNGTVFAKGSADSIDKSPYLVWREVIHSIFSLHRFLEMPRKDFEQTAIKTMGKWLSDNVPHLSQQYHVLGLVLGLDWHDPKISPLTPRENFDVLCNVLTEILQKRSNVIIIDNAQWMDAQSWQLTFAIAQSCPKIMMILSMRPMRNPLPVEFVQIQRMENKTHMIQLQGMDPSDLVRIVKQKLSIKNLPPQVEEQLEIKMKELPFPILAQETAAQLKDQGFVEYNSKTHEGQIKPLRQLEMVIPNSLRGIITAKIDRLTASQQLVLKTASVIGTTFPVMCLLDILPVSGSELISGTNHTNSEKIREIAKKMSKLTNKVDPTVLLRVEEELEKQKPVRLSRNKTSPMETSVTKEETKQPTVPKKEHSIKPIPIPQVDVTLASKNSGRKVSHIQIPKKVEDSELSKKKIKRTETDQGERHHQTKRVKKKDKRADSTVEVLCSPKTRAKRNTKHHSDTSQQGAHPKSKIQSGYLDDTDPALLDFTVESPTSFSKIESSDHAKIKHFYPGLSLLGKETPSDSDGASPLLSPSLQFSLDNSLDILSTSTDVPNSPEKPNDNDSSLESLQSPSSQLSDNSTNQISLPDYVIAKKGQKLSNHGMANQTPKPSQEEISTNPSGLTQNIFSEVKKQPTDQVTITTPPDKPPQIPEKVTQNVNKDPVPTTSHLENEPSPKAPESATPNIQLEPSSVLMESNDVPQHISSNSPSEPDALALNTVPIIHPSELKSVVLHTPIKVGTNSKPSSPQEDSTKLEPTIDLDSSDKKILIFTSENIIKGGDENLVRIEEEPKVVILSSSTDDCSSTEEEEEIPVIHTERSGASRKEGLTQSHTKTRHSHTLETRKTAEFLRSTTDNKKAVVKHETHHHSPQTKKSKRHLSERNQKRSRPKTTSVIPIPLVTEPMPSAGPKLSPLSYKDLLMENVSLNAKLAEVTRQNELLVEKVKLASELLKSNNIPFDEIEKTEKNEKHETDKKLTIDSPPGGKKSKTPRLLRAKSPRSKSESITPIKLRRSSSLVSVNSLPSPQTTGSIAYAPSLSFLPAFAISTNNLPLKVPKNPDGPTSPNKERKRRRLSMKPNIKLKHPKQKSEQSIAPYDPPPPSAVHFDKGNVENEIHLTQLNVILEELEELGYIMKIKSEEGTDSYKFKESMLGDILADTILPSERIHLHEKIALWHEKNSMTSDVGIVSLIAHHWYCAEKPEKAILYYAKAAELAMTGFSHLLASSYLHKAVDLYKILYPEQVPQGFIPESDDSKSMKWHYDCVKWQRQLGECYYNLGNMEKALEHYSIGTDLLKEPIPSSIPNIIEFQPIFPMISQASLQQNKCKLFTPGDEKFKKISRMLGRKSKGNDQEYMRIMLGFGQVYFLMFRSELVSYCTLKALVVAEQLGTVSSELRRALISCIISAGITDNQLTGHSYLKVGKVLFKDQWDRRAMLAEGIFFSGPAEWGKSDVLLESARMEAEHLGDARTFEECCLHLSFNKFYQGKMEEATNDGDAIMPYARSRGDLQMQILSLFARAIIKFHLGKISQFYSILTDLEGYLSEKISFRMDDLSKLTYRSLLAIKFYKEGKYLDAFNLSNEVDQLYRELSHPTVYYAIIGIYYSVLIRLLFLMKQDDWDSNSQHKTFKITWKKLISSCGKSIKQMEDFSKIFLSALPFTLICKGLYDQVQKKKSTHLEEGLNSALTMKMPLLAGIIHQWIGLSLAIRDNAATQQQKLNHRDEAMKIFIKLDVADTQLLWN